MQNFTAFFNYFYPKISKSAWVGLFLIISALMIILFDKTYQQVKLERLKFDLVEIEKNNNLAKKKTKYETFNAEINNFLQFHKKSDLPDIFEFIQTTAEQNNISIENEDYKLIELNLIHFTSYEITFPAVGSYLDFMKFLTKIKSKYKEVALKNIELSREGNQSNQLDGFLQLVIYVKTSMKSNLDYKKLLYICLFITLLASAYFKYQDSLKHDFDSIVVASFAINKVEKNDNLVGSESDKANNYNFAKVDIFETYKKPSPPAPKELIVQKIVPKVAAVVFIEAPPPLPVAPPLPFKYIGKIFGDDEYQVFVAFNEKNLILKEGDIIQQTYKIEKIEPPFMKVTYIPMNILQNMQIGEIN